MNQIKTIWETNEEKFDLLVNQAIRDGWEPNFSTYRVTPTFNGAQRSGFLGGAGGVSSGSGNSIILTKEEPQ